MVDRSIAEIRISTSCQGSRQPARFRPDARRSLLRHRHGREVAAGQKLLTLEAMKMETTLPGAAGKIAEVLADRTQVAGVCW